MTLRRAQGLSKDLHRAPRSLGYRVLPMAPPSHHLRGDHHRPRLALFAGIGSAWVFALITMGAFTTSISAGMIFPDWPLSNGSVNPQGWLENTAMFAEHSHRLFGQMMGMITITLAVWLAFSDSRRWLRRLGWAALAIVIVQGLIGGFRVLLDSIDVPGFHMSLGQMLRIPHGILAQIFVCLLFAIAMSVSKSWIETPVREFSRRTRQLAWGSTALLFVQLVVAASMRHNHAGLAIPTFPLTPEGGLLPAEWNFNVAIHFTHRVLALALGIQLVWFALVLFRDPAAGRGVLRAAGAMLALLVTQISLGAASIWTVRNPYVTTAHVIVGACLLAVTFSIAWWTRRAAFVEPSRIVPQRSLEAAPFAQT